MAHGTIKALAAAMQVRLLDDMITNPFPAEKAGGYEGLSRYYDDALKNAGAGVTELFLHPSEPDEALERRTPQWVKREWEYRYLCSDAFQRLLERERFLLVNWGGAPLQ